MAIVSALLSSASGNVHSVRKPARVIADRVGAEPRLRALSELQGHVPVPTTPPACPFNPYRGFWNANDPDLKLHWTFSDGNITSQTCQRRFHVSSRGATSHRYTPAEAHQCLAGKHVVFVGDSTIREQMKALAIFLQTGEEPVSFKFTPLSVYGSRHPDMPAGHASMREIDERSNPVTMLNNAYYHNAKFDINVTLLSVFAYGCGRSPVGWLPPGQRGFDMSRYAWADASLGDMSRIIRQYFGQVDELVMNAGRWSFHTKVGEWMRNITSGNVEDVMAEFREFEAVMKTVSH
jgi:hypothetical protein